MEAEDIEIFLNSIRNYPELYAVGHADYKNAYKKEVAWRKVQEKIGINVKTMKTKWRNLRDTYKKYKQSQQTSSGQAAKKLANWQWADQMSFIDSSINLRETDSTLEASRVILDTNTLSTENEHDNSTEAEQVSNNKQNELRIVQELEAVETTSETNPTREISRRRRRVSNDDPADKIINYLKTRKSGNTGKNTV
ncbi:unnamed protein product [Arctia plantaginis]|uniref:MADF domain-containing protein n=1 Tax=Arctia plantaginis TaxID=874455 RepID=A0A8S1ARY6_ARCPL|nr:unnamed protein product [Arctia plantaginis]